MPTRRLLMQTRRVAFLYTTFPVQTETFLRRELLALAEQGVEPELFSMWKGDPEWRGRAVRRLSGFDWFALLWRVPIEALCSGGVFFNMLGRLFSHRPKSIENCLENLAGFAAAITWLPTFRARGFAHVHAAWASGPASAAWYLARRTGITWSTGAHAYDVFRHGGDWLLADKVRAANLVQCSTRLARERVLSVGADPADVLWVRRGVLEFPPLAPARTNRHPLRLLSVARMVPKKGHGLQLEVFRRLRSEGIEFQAVLVGDGPERARVAAEVARSNLGDCVQVAGALDEDAVAARFAWADVLLHTGVVAANGDRDGLPNVIGEAMSRGVLVVATPVAGVVEAIESGWNGLLASPDDPEAWVSALRRLQEDDELLSRLRLAARCWAEAHFDARRSAARLWSRLLAVIADAEEERREDTTGRPAEAGETGSAPKKRRRKRKRKAPSDNTAPPSEVSTALPDSPPQLPADDSPATPEATADSASSTVDAERSDAPRS